MRESGDLLTFVKKHVPVSQDVENKLIAEQVSLTTFAMLQENDLKDLGFPMGPRKVLLNVIDKLKAVQAQQQGPVQSSDHQQNDTSIGQGSVDHQPFVRSVTDLQYTQEGMTRSSPDMPIVGGVMNYPGTSGGITRLSKDTRFAGKVSDLPGTSGGITRPSSDMSVAGVVDLPGTAGSITRPSSVSCFLVVL